MGRTNLNQNHQHFRYFWFSDSALALLALLRRDIGIGCPLQHIQTIENEGIKHSVQQPTICTPCVDWFMKTSGTKEQWARSTSKLGNAVVSCSVPTVVVGGASA